MTPGDRIRKIRKDLKLTQAKFGDNLGFAWYKVKDLESGKIKVSPEIAKSIETSFSYRLEWILTGEGPETKEQAEAVRQEQILEMIYRKLPERKKDSDAPANETFSEPPRHPAAALMPSPDSGPPGVDPAVQAMADIKEIFDSRDPILVPAIQANLNAFKRALQREKQFNQVLQENKEIKALLDSLKAQFLELSKEVNRLKATYEAPNGGDGRLTNSEKQAM